MYNYIHIPKTGGNWVNHYVGPQNSQMTLLGHRSQLQDYNNVVFTLRHPVDKFISGACYLHNIVNPDSELDSNAIIRYYQSEFPIRTKMFFAQIILQPLSVNLGTLEEYKTNEHQVHQVIDFDYVTEGYANLLNLERPIPEKQNVTKPYNKNIDAELTEWITEYLAEDFELYEYIRSRPYYITAP